MRLRKSKLWATLLSVTVLVALLLATLSTALADVGAGTVFELDGNFAELAGGGAGRLGDALHRWGHSPGLHLYRGRA